MNRPRRTSLLSFIPTAILVLAAIPGAQAQRYNFRTFTQAEGLTDLTICCFLQDRTGFLWIGTNNGLFRYDGRRFRRFGVESGLLSASISSLVETNDGTLWVGALNGVGRKSGDQFAREDLRDSFPTQGPQTLARDPFGSGVYIATTKGLVLLPERGARTVISNTAGRPVWSVFAEPGKGVWYALSDAVCLWNGTGSRCYGSQNGFTKDQWGGLVIDGDGTLWVRSATSLLVLPRGASQFEMRNEGLASTIQDGAICLDSRKRPMIPTDDGLARWTGSGWSLISGKDGLVVSAASWAMEDREGSLWIGMRGGGLARWLGSEEWENWTTAQGLDNDQIWSIARDRTGGILIGTGSGLARLRNGRVEMVPGTNLGLTSNRVRGISVDSDNMVWLGTSPGGLARLDLRSGRMTRFDASNGMPVQRILSVAADRNHSVWAATPNGVFRGTPTGSGRWIWSRQAIPNTLETEIFYHVLEDRDGRIWAAGTEGLAVWDGRHWVRVPGADGRRSRLAAYLAQGPDGSIWVAYRDSGKIDRIANRDGKWVTSGIPSGGVSGIPDVNRFLGFDRDGNLWHGTGAGVRVLGRSNYWIRYTHAEGLAWDDTSSNAFLGDPDGSVWLGTSHGLSHHRPFTEQAAQPPVPPIVVGVQAGDKTLAADEPLRIDSRAGAVVFSYASLTFRREQDVRFRYRLRGLDDTWTSTGEWQARYPVLKPGSYLFEVAAATWDGRSSSAVASIPVTIAGPWWSATWFLTGLGLFFAGILLASWRIRERRHAQKKLRLEIAVRDRTSELERERERDRRQREILEMLVTAEPLERVLDGVVRLISAQAPGVHVAILLKGENCPIAAAPDFPPEWLKAFTAPHALPREIWRKHCLYDDPRNDPAWRAFTAELGGMPPGLIGTRPIGSADAALGVVLLCWPSGSAREQAAAASETLAVGERMAQVAIEHSRLYDSLNFHARHDSLTGLPNRLLFAERIHRSLREAKARGERLAVLFVDLDRFKRINDTTSHRIGDLLLCEIATRMSRVLRPGDTMARIGGDEFNIVATNLGEASEAEGIAARIMAAVREPILIEGHQLTTSASVGIAVFPEDGSDAEALQRAADAAMYCAKGLGRNRAQTFAARNDRLDRARMEQDLRVALRDGQLSVHYQPKVTADGRLAGFEALARLKHPQFGEIPPEKFIPVAEESGLIVPLGAWIVNEVCRQIAEWKIRGLDSVGVAINVSPVQIARPDFAKTVVACMERHHVSPADIEFELTEGILITGDDECHEQMRALRSMGIRLSIDDFGTGYSSLSYLHRLQVDTIKLDQSFVQSIDTNHTARRLVQAVIGVAHGLGLNIVAEGVETESQREALIAAGCHTMQGFLFARPRPAADLEEILRKHLASAQPRILALEAPLEITPEIEILSV
jgi:diguanylate cyclase (GGDEF)-like protein